MLKAIGKTIALCAFGIAMTVSGQAGAQQSPASNQVQVTATKTVDLLNARFVSIAAGNQYIIDANGTQHAASTRPASRTSRQSPTHRPSPTTSSTARVCI